MSGRRGWAAVIAIAIAGVFSAAHSVRAQDPGRPAVGMVDVPTVKVLRGLTVPEFEAEMQFMNQALGVACGHCHVRNNFASDDNPKKAAARRMLEMTQAINKQFFAYYRPQGEESKLGKVTCYTCHQGAEKPKPPEP
jgi:photosynthetic reaction center cytochrome c subunit